MASRDRPRTRRTRRLLRSLVVDIEPLRASRGFRWLYAGQAGAALARQILVVAVPYQVFVLTESSLLVGMVGLVQIAPLIVFSILGGTIADAFDRRRVLLVAELLIVLTSVALALNTGSDAKVWPIFVLMALNAGITGVEGPTRSAMIPSLVERSRLPSAFALNQTLSQTAQVVGPALAGVVMAALGIGLAYWLSVAAGLMTVAALLPLGPQTPDGATGRITWRATAEGWRYLRGVPLLQQTMLIDLNAMVFGMPRALFPAIGLVVLGGDAATVGLLHAAPGAGALLSAVTTGWVAGIKAQGRAVVVAVIVWGTAIAAFGVSRHLATSLVLLAVAGGADVVSNVFRNTILQAVVPDNLRGRLTAFKVALSDGGPRLGDAEAGAVASLTTPTFSVVSGGLACIVGAAAIAWRGRAIWDQRTSDPVRPVGPYKSEDR